MPFILESCTSSALFISKGTIWGFLFLFIIGIRSFLLKEKEPKFLNESIEMAAKRRTQEELGLEINPKKFKHIQNKTIPSPLRPKFRNSNQTNIYFLSKKRFEGKKKDLLIKRIKLAASIVLIGIGGYLLSS